MLTREELKDYRLRCDLTLRDVAKYCDISHQLIGTIERGERDLTEYNYREFVKGINAANYAKRNGTLGKEESPAATQPDTANDPPPEPEKPVTHAKKAGKAGK